MGTKSDRKTNRLVKMALVTSAVVIVISLFLATSFQPVLAQAGTGTPAATGTAVSTSTLAPTAAATGTSAATAAPTSTPAPTAVPTLAPPQPTASTTALVPVTGADLSVQAAQQSLYVNLGIVSLGLVLVVIGILIRTNRE
ncbi:MAG: hypothetical protein M1281_15010 [Chloroflexi bacterium]|nr:hypothetical protein [Chloroflexota bacterium]